ncbi:MAG: hypothetical protein CVV03_06120 [Firmicutes bacterium HGW-Firmicutes-8]|nr:MAG: hypothetical protein CVV03_06120 [Firmicutes bacterium HGW-Firmicutes-8]
MKKVLAFVLVFVLLLTLFPAAALAAYDQDLEKAINSAKAIFDIPKTYNNFSYNISKQNDKTVFNLNWTDKNMQGNVSVTIDSAAKIISYYSYKNVYGRDQKKLPSVSRSDAQIIAENFINKINPASRNKIKFQQNNNPPSIADRNYYFNYIRYENGIPFPENNISVSIDGMTGEVQSYYCNWYEDSVFPESKGVMSLEEAQKQFTDKLGLKLVFKLGYEVKETTPYLVYTNVYSNRFLDAKTGEVMSGDGYFGYYGGMGREKMAMDSRMGGYAPQKPASLTPEEQQAVEKAANIMDQAEAEERARKALNISPDLKLNYVSLYSDWRNKDDYIWNMDFGREEKLGGTTRYYNVSVSMNAANGDIMSFYRGVPYDEDAVVKYTEEQSLKIAVDMIKSLKPDKLSEVERVTWNVPEMRPMNGEKPRESYFNFTRKVSGAYFLDNGFNINVDNVTGTVTSYSYSWYNKTLPSTDKIITAAEADKLFFEKVGIQLQYISQDPSLKDSRILPVPSNREKWDVKLIYAVKPEKPANIDAFTGEVLDYSGKPLVTGDTAQYTDIGGHYAASRIKVLKEFGISLPGTQLIPNQTAQQREFLYLLYKAVNPYNNLAFPENSEDDDNMYSYLIEAGIVKEGEKSPKSIITRQEAVKFVIRALKYDKVAEINKGIYLLPFKDADKIGSGLYGYMAVAYGLNIISGSNGYCNPGNSLTRADAFVLVYNFLNV